MADQQKLTSEEPPAYAAAVGGVAPPGGYPQSNPYPSTSAPYPPQPNAAPYPPEQTAPYSSQPQPQPGVGGYAPPSYQPKGGAYPSQAYTPYVQQETNVAIVTNQPTLAAVGVVGVKPQNYLVLSIVSIFCFCWLFGLIALLYSLQVDSAWARGDVGAARSSSRNARGWNIASIITGVGLTVLIIVISVASNAVRYSTYNYNY